MAGLVPAIHVFLACGAKNVDARVKPGHDGELATQAVLIQTAFTFRYSSTCCLPDSRP
jgi:hypothetical protein